MQRARVISSNIESVGYDGEAQILETEFMDGAVYQYYNVPASIHEGLMRAASHGSYFHTHIRDVYRYRRVR